jgi:hypothetical protein
MLKRISWAGSMYGGETISWGTPKEIDHLENLATEGEQY